MLPDWVYAIILAVIEGLTEFIPVSSTGMMLLAKQAMGLPSGFWDTFAVMIQLGAILAVVALYFGRLWKQVVSLPTDPEARKFALSVIVAFIPSIQASVIPTRSRGPSSPCPSIHILTEEPPTFSTRRMNRTFSPSRDGRWNTASIATVGTPLSAPKCIEAKDRPTTSAKKLSMTELTISK